MKVTVHRDRCISSGQCVLSAPNVFEQSDSDGCVQLLDEQPPAESHDAVRDAANLCPTQTIEVQQD